MYCHLKGAKVSQYWKSQKRSRYIHINKFLNYTDLYLMKLTPFFFLSLQKSGLRDLTTSKTPEASISAALSRDTKLFERTAPSTYCVKTPYRKDPADSEALLSAAREKIRVFQNALSECEEVEKDVDEAERDEDSECDDAEDDADGDDMNIEDKDSKSPLVAQDGSPITVVGDIKKESNSVVNTLVPQSIQTKSSGSDSLHTLDSKASTSTDPAVGDDGKDTEIDESNQGSSWVQGLAEGDYSDLSVDERINALVALIGVATEGNSIRAILEVMVLLFFFILLFDH